MLQKRVEHQSKTIKHFSEQSIKYEAELKKIEEKLADEHREAQKFKDDHVALLEKLKADFEKDQSKQKRRLNDLAIELSQLKEENKFFRLHANVNVENAEKEKKPPLMARLGAASAKKVSAKASTATHQFKSPQKAPIQQTKAR